MLLNINTFDKLPSINRSRVGIFFGVFVSVIFTLYAVTQLLYARFNLILIFTTVLFNDILILVSIMVCIVIIFYNLYMPAKNIVTQINDYGVQVGEWKYDYQSIKAFSIVDLGRYFEIILKTSDIRTPFVYFYVDENNPNLPELINVMAELIPYQETLEEIDKFHIFLRNFGLK